MNTPSLRYRLPLPAGLRREDILAFHRRDAEAVAEQVTEDSLHKGLVWHGCPASLGLHFHGDAVDAHLDLQAPPAEDAAPARTLAAFEAMVQRMLGLQQDVEAFERAHRHHPQLGPLLARQAGLRVPATATPFEALSWAITGQQISVHAAVAIRRRMIEACGLRLPGGLHCHPDAKRVLALGEAGLRQVGFTASKACTLMGLSEAVQAGQLPLDAWLEAPTAGTLSDLSERLLALKGIGPWTVSYALMRGYGWLDGSLHGDVAVRRALGALLAQDTGSASTPPPGPPSQPPTVTPQAAEAWLAPLSPWRALAAAHLWASLAMAA